MTVNPSYRAPRYVIGQPDEYRLMAQLQSLRELVQGDPDAHPPMKYLIAGLHDITGSRKVSYDDRKHPHVIEGQVTSPAAPATAAELISFEKELALLRKRVVPGNIWPYDTDTLWENLQALKLGRLIFPSLVKDE
ncbi:MAG: hypothetical protein NVSMB39_1490 [Candidatus Saccharimonadales bacterium]